MATSDEIVECLDEFWEVLGKEIQWSEDHFNSINKSYKYKVGYLMGLKAARDLLIDFEVVKLRHVWTNKK